MLLNGQDLDMGVAHLAHVVDELDRKVVVGVVLAALRGEGIHGAGVVAVLVGIALRLVAVAAPGAKMDLIDVEGLLHMVGRRAVGHPGGVAPLIAADVHQARCGARNLLGKEAVGIRLVQQLSVFGLDDVLIQVALCETCDKALPKTAGGQLLEVINVHIPTVEVADDADAFDLGCPDAKTPSLNAFLDVGMGAHFLPAAVP